MRPRRAATLTDAKTLIGAAVVAKVACGRLAIALVHGRLRRALVIMRLS